MVLTSKRLQKLYRRTGRYWACLLLPLLVTACDGESGSNPAATTGGGTPQEGGSLVWARYGDADSLDPQRTTTTLSWQVFDQIYDTLLAFDDNGEVVPNLAKEWTVSEDGLTATFVLNEGITCHDGTPFDANDVKYTAERAISEDNPSVTKGAWGPIASVEAVDSQTVQFNFSEPFGAFVSFMADPFSSQICDSAEELGDDFGVSAAVGTGPWKLVSWTKGDEIVLEKNADYQNFGRPIENDGAPYLDQLIVKQIPEPQTRLAGLQTGEIQVIAEPPLEELEAIEADEGLNNYIAEKTGQNVFFEFTTSRPPFDDIRARQAVAYAIDPEAAIDIVFGDVVKREKCTVARGVMGNDQGFCAEHGYSHDPERAQELLAELGYGPENPLTVTMMTWVGGNRERMVQVFQNQLKQVGIETEIETMDIGTLNARVKQENENDSGQGTFDMMGWAWYDPDILHQLWHSPGAYSGYQSAELDALLDDTRTTVDSDARLAAVQEAQQYLLENAVHVPLYTPGWLWIYTTRSEVDGFKIGPFDRPLFNDVKLVS
ncbi:ABC transporter substrate-binding protein [cf. Phormidesmis sp. LEGE 11477]|uniref:ABC transporter substrate-binding protein n=1 Tax=cf. Phormidesmis sp. LEGE 11477 TaxID=1828680 RepID=UPI001881CBD4|nr:ABC transporter substrate-binding protein [cf. Phormidesmis sp. LEGE 11477]MBE9063228.1 ABC transporter substrate-binding protein [cf. Phormidesmis sp. LEGE 11477]